MDPGYRRVNRGLTGRIPQFRALPRAYAGDEEDNEDGAIDADVDDEMDDNANDKEVIGVDVDENDEDPLFVPVKGQGYERKVENSAAYRLKEQYEKERRSKPGKYRRGGRALGAPIPATGTNNPTNRKIARALKKKNKTQDTGEEDDSIEPRSESEEGSESRDRKKKWEIHAQPLINQQVPPHKPTRNRRHNKGPNDPENHEIVRLYEIHHDFKVVCKMINDARVRKGLKPHFKPNNIN